MIEQAVRVLEALALPLEFTCGEIGFGAYQKYGSPLPDQTLALIRSSKAALFGAVTTPSQPARVFFPGYPDAPGF